MTETLTAEQFRELNFQVTPQMKHRNQIVEADGIKFRSKLEAKYYGKLKLLKKQGVVTDFKMQVKYPFVHNGIKVTAYIADFVVTWASGAVTVEDCKGFITDTYKIKRACMLAFYGITIKEVK